MPEDVEAQAMAEPVLPDVPYDEAVQGYISQHGTFPNARQFGLFLAQYGIVDSVTGGVLTEAQLRPVLQEVKMTAPQMSEPAREKPGDEEAWSTVIAPETGARSGLADVSADVTPASSEMGSETVAGPQVQQPRETEAPVPTASATTGTEVAGGTAPRQAAPRGGVAGSDAEPGEGPSQLGGSIAGDTGTVTGLLPKQQTDEPALDPVQQQIMTVAEWLIEAEKAEEKLSGAEVGRRFGLSPRTGQRRLDKAAEYVAEQRRQQGRVHLRSVRS
ncbi:hypothetical protein GCM10010207_85510 [Streptomyces atratus]|nr:hypothetical protein GCM10010207_85510 [Streptomyces atratus]